MNIRQNCYLLIRIFFIQVIASGVKGDAASKTAAAMSGRIQNKTGLTGHSIGKDVCIVHIVVALAD